MTEEQLQRPRGGSGRRGLKPSAVSPRIGFFDRFAGRMAQMASRAPFITFLLVSLLQNSQTRSAQAVQHKLNALDDGLADLRTGRHA
jgi:low affinity Fe/Cu permease